MTQEEKQLLLKDLCARQPYGVKVNAVDKYISTISSIITTLILLKDISPVFDIDEVKPYLRPMSSMTTKEEYFYYSCLDEVDGYKQTFPIIYQDKALSLLDWLNEHHFDYRGLIPMGLALEAPEGMYKTE